MTKLSICRSIGLGAAVLTAGGGMLASSALAAPSTYLTVVGSNTTQDLMQVVTADFNSHNTSVQATNVFAQPADPGTVAPSDAACNGGNPITYVQENPPPQGDVTAPNGSGAGRAALAASVSAKNSCISVARSSSPPVAATDPAGTKAYAYAVDAVSWVASATGNAPKNLSTTQLQGIYDCSITDWSQVGGKPGAIVRYYPQAGSGSASFFDSAVLGFDPRVIGGMNACPTPAISIEENEATSIAPADVPNAIMIYSAGAYIAQGNGVPADPDKRNGFTVRTINKKPNPVAGTPGAYKTGSITVEKNVEPLPVNSNVGSNTAVQGVRNLFNFINTNSVDYAAAVTFVGPGSRLCTNKDAAAIKTYGFYSLKSCLLVTG